MLTIYRKCAFHHCISELRDWEQASSADSAYEADGENETDADRRSLVQLSFATLTNFLKTQLMKDTKPSSNPPKKKRNYNNARRAAKAEASKRLKSAKATTTTRPARNSEESWSINLDKCVLFFIVRLLCFCVLLGKQAANVKLVRTVCLFDCLRSAWPASCKRSANALLGHVLTSSQFKRLRSFWISLRAGTNESRIWYCIWLVTLEPQGWLVDESIRFCRNHWADDALNTLLESAPTELIKLAVLIRDTPATRSLANHLCWQQALTLSSWFSMGQWQSHCPISSLMLSQ